MSDPQRPPPTGSSVQLTPGTVLKDTYRIEAELGSGGMGTVYRATHLQLDKLVAVKVLKPQFFDTPEALSRFSREARMAARIDHPVMTQVMDYGVEGNLPFIVMEYVRGETLAELLQPPQFNPLSWVRGLHPTEAIEVMRQLLSLLRTTHALGIVHRDLKPANIKIFTDDCQIYVKVLDFGVAKEVDGDATQLTAEGALVGTPAYMAPEQFTDKPVDGRTDLYAAGLIFHEMLSGNRAVAGKTLPSIFHAQMNEPPPPIDGLPDIIARTLAKLVKKNPEERFQDATEADHALAECEEAVRGTAVEHTGGSHRFLVRPATIIPGARPEPRPEPVLPSLTVPPNPSPTVVFPAPTPRPSAWKTLARIAVGAVGVLLLLFLALVAIGLLAKRDGQSNGTPPSQARQPVPGPSEEQEKTAHDTP